MFAKLKERFTGTVSKFSGRKDFLEAVCAAAALVASADGTVSDEEINATIKSITSNAALSGAFSSREIETTAERMLQRANGGRVGRNGLYKEIEDIRADTEMCETVLLTALDVADSGGIDDKEKAILGEIAKRLGLSLEKYI